LQLSKTYSAAGSADDVKGFGHTLQLQFAEETAVEWARQVETAFTAGRPSENKEEAEENDSFKQNVKSNVYCMGSEGIGKSKLLSSGLTVMRGHCKDPVLLQMLAEEGHPLQLLVTFKGRRAYDADSEPRVNVSLGQRLLDAYYDHPDIVDAAPLHVHSNSARDCLDYIIEDHRRRNFIPGQLFVYIGVDDVQALLSDLPGDRTTRLLELVRCLDDLRDHTNSISNTFVTTLVSGSHVGDFKQMLEANDRYWRDYTTLLRLPPLSVDQILLMLRLESGLDGRYFDSQAFIDLVRDVGPSLRDIGIMVTAMSSEFDEKSIASGRAAVLEYYNRVLQECDDLDSRHQDVLLSLAVSGYSSFNNYSSTDPLIEGSVHSLDSLQNAGLCLLAQEKSIPYVGSNYKIIVNVVNIPLLLLEQFSVTTAGQGLKDRTLQLKRLCYAPEGHPFDQFVAEHFALKMIALRLLSLYRYSDIDDGTDVPLWKIYRNTVIDLYVHVDRYEDDCRVVQNETRSPPQPYPENGEDEEKKHFLQTGGVLKNTSGATIDILSIEKNNDATDLLQAIVVDSTSKDTKEAIEARIQEVETTLSKSAAFKGIKNTVIVVASINNIDDLWSNRLNRGTIKFGENQFQSVFGSVFGRLVHAPKMLPSSSTSSRRSFSTATHHHRPSCCWHGSRAVLQKNSMLLSTIVKVLRKFR
jgi:hypothetical protein